MNAVQTPVYSKMAKTRKPKADVNNLPEPLTGDRVEFQAPSDWVVRLDAAAAALGMSRSAYIRMSISRQMLRDKKGTDGD